MKTLVFYICIFSLIPFILAKVLIPKRPGDEYELYNTCVNEQDVLIDDMFTDQDIIHNRIPESETERIRKNGCVYQCMLEKINVMEGSEFKLDEMHSKLNLSQRQETLLTDCVNEANVKTDKCEKSLALVVCYVMGEKAQAAPGEHEENGHEHEENEHEA